MNLIVFMTYTLDGSCQIHFNSVESRNVRQRARFAHSSPGVLEKQTFSVHRRAATLALSRTHAESSGNLKARPWAIFFLLVVTSSQHSARLPGRMSNIKPTSDLLTQNHRSSTLQSQQHLWYCLQNQQHNGISH